MIDIVDVSEHIIMKPIFKTKRKIKRGENNRESEY
jgi:hypothetical protein